MSHLPTPTNNTAALQSLLDESQQHIDRGRALLSRFTELAPHMLAPREWVNLQIPHKLIDVQTQLEYAIWYEQTGKNMKPLTKEEVRRMRGRYEESKRKSQFSSLVECERSDSQISELQLESSQRVDLQLVESQVSGKESLLLPVSSARPVNNSHVASPFANPQKQAARQLLHTNVPKTLGRGIVMPNRRQDATPTNNTDIQATIKKPVNGSTHARSTLQPPIQPAVPPSRTLTQTSNTKAPASLKRSQRASSEESENSDYRPTSSAGSSPSLSPSASPGPNSAPTTSRHGAPPAKRRALPTTPIRRPPCAAPRPALEINRNTPLTPSAGVSKTNQQLLGEFVLMSITEVAALDPTELQRKAKGIKALASFAGKVSNPDLIGRFMEWQNTMLELERGEAGAGEEAVTPSQATPSQANTPSGRRKIQGNTDEELLDTFVFKSMQELKNMLAADLRDLIRGVEALRQYFNGVNKGGMIKYYMEWQMGMVAMKQEREEDEDEDEDEEDEDEEEVEDEEAKEDEEEEEEDEYEEAKEGKEEEVVTKAVAARKAPVVIDLVSDSEDEESGGTMNSVGRVASRKQEMRMVEV
ncbi:hypothetical protein EG328_002295 [Venturia inaequalis]|uniref:Uncharacterized protein n=1 Tax=Venturia inaequalis TaxID=5025 RepID=A0A8H3UUT9_VENIN|nr:hypothetical protein EG328_002295 [Venturia inaequalis]KAE9981258.1 hypothetical protein EG327_006269 [Venturia inaequalis]